MADNQVNYFQSIFILVLPPNNTIFTITNTENSNIKIS